MDSLTQIVLGAACGEAVLGKKIGNKALLFGAVGGTLPDLDVFIGPWLYSNEIQAMAFHRGFIHSILFSILGAFLFGWLTHKLYDKGKRFGTTTLKDWRLLFFWSLLTHPILDCFTPYGTQLFYPFTDYRVAFNTISVADPLYTIPFLIGLIVILFYKRQNSKRRLWLKIGIGISSAYMLFTIANKIYINHIFKASLKVNDITYLRYRSQPTILNNILWYGVAETETEYYLGFYSLLDKSNRITDWKIIKKDTIDLVPIKDKDLATLAWFSNDYYKVRLTDIKGEYTYSDLRYPLLDPEDSESSLFTFKIFKKNERWDMKNSGPDFEEGTTISDVFGPMLKRLKGK
ncbi:metal-dependent hydrolase [Winogradskyella immobilis]|uniref:Metal-dependent hydrolase n=1 Tax=Winogradskyella immobilis TaxID=2816852 RepID=A0ABS8EKT7_9FLAO|nr:metal-dependent hydrolase [Winogradskyella immobilis]MCC1483636.1 metal-dependent hydrolase [Winogradskyella immobilis]MCG0015730.1 metal-dependent hydrolase [Winogradskyella immobilis]